MRRSGLRLVAFALASVFLPAGCGGSEATPAGASAAEVRAALEARQLDKNLSFRWVACVRTKRSFAGSTIFRCNVDFGEPHIVRYCATLEDGRFVTNHEQPGMRCGRRSPQ